MGYKVEPGYIPSGKLERRLNLGSGSNIRKGFINLDRAPAGIIAEVPKFPNETDYIEWDWELNRTDEGYVLPFKNDAFDYILARDVMEHIPHRVTDKSGEFFHRIVDDMIRITKSGGKWEIISPHRPEILGAAGHTRLIDESTFMPWVEKSIGMDSGDMLTTPKSLTCVVHKNSRQWDARDYLRFGRSIVKILVFRVDKRTG